MYLSTIEGFGVESDSGRVSTLGTVDSDLSPKFYPWHSEDGAGIGTGQREHVLLIMLQQIQHTWEKQDRGDSTSGCLSKNYWQAINTNFGKTNKTDKDVDNNKCSAVNIFL